MPRSGGTYIQQVRQFEEDENGDLISVDVNTIFESDEEMALMPSTSGEQDPFYEIDLDGNITPQA